MSKHPLTATERQILNALLFKEDFPSLMMETGLPYGVLRDDLMTLISRGWVEVYDDCGLDSGTSQRRTKNQRMNSQAVRGDTSSTTEDASNYTSKRTMSMSSAPSAFYDSDNIQDFSFKATKNGLRGIRHGNV